MKIFLIGMMGSGKSTLGEMVSNILSIPFIDIDNEIEKSENMKIKDIFEKKGEKYFRVIESSYLEKLTQKKGPFVVSTGGGIILNSKNRSLLHNENTFYLKVSPNELKKRVHLENRPLLKNNRDNIIEIYQQRKELYEEFETIDITDLNEWESVAKIIYKLNIEKDLEVGSSFQKVSIQSNALKHIPDNNIVFLSEKVNQLYGSFFPQKKLILPNGEKTKDISYVLKAYEYLLENNVSRSDTLIGIGGGTITDFSGFVGTTYKRGMNFSFYPTTLLGQIDASIGGKNGIDFKRYKNVVGTINLPNKVIIDPISLLSLEDKLFLEGLIEGFKMCLIAGGDFYNFFKYNLELLLKRNLDKLSWFIKRSVEEKLRIVEKDFNDTGLRSSLNLGHTFGHAFEAITGISHGLSVGWGLIKEVEYFKEKNYLQKNYYIEIIKLLEKLLPENIRKIQTNSKEMIHYIANDKKIGERKKIKMPILNSPGDVIIKEIDISDFFEIL